MKLDVVTLFPEMLSAVTEYGVTGRAVNKGLLQVETWNPREHRTVDDRPYGGGPGMVMLARPLADALQAARKAGPAGRPVVYLSPQGQRLTHERIQQAANGPGLILLAGRYEGVDERLLQTEVDEEWSIGDYVLSGGELPAMVVIDALARQIPGVLGDAASAEEDSFVDGLLDCGHYTRPERYGGLVVPPVLLSGDHGEIRRWRLKQALGRTWLRRPDLLAQRKLSKDEQQLLHEFQLEHEQSGVNDEQSDTGN